MSEHENDQSERYPFNIHISNFVRHADAIRNALPALVVVADNVRQQTVDNIRELGESHGTVHDLEDGGFRISVPPHRTQRLNKLDKNYQRFDSLITILSRAGLVSLVSLWDAYLVQLIRGIFFTNPESLNSSGRNISISELMSFDSLEDARAFVIEKEIESVLRKSHGEQFSWLEDRLSIPLTKKLDVWPRFVEITERRNLFVHNGGIVTRQYLDVCERASASPGADQPGQQLDVSRSYLSAACLVMVEIAAKLGFVMWSKLVPEDRGDAVNHLNNLALGMMDDSGHYRTALKLFRFPFDTPAQPDDEMGIILKVNQAMTHKFMGDKDGCDGIVASINWGPLSDKYKFAKALLEDNHDEAAAIMRRIGTNEEISQHDYHKWPILREFRKTEQFARTYKEIFGEEFSGASGTIADSEGGGAEEE